MSEAGRSPTNERDIARTLALYLNGQEHVTFPSDDDLRALFKDFPWDEILNDEKVRQSYGDYPILNLIRAHVLPYLLLIRSGRELFSELAERELLQRLCGFTSADLHAPPPVPSRGTLWNFRRRYREQFRGWITRVLAGLILRSLELELRLPFFTKVEEAHSLSDDKYHYMQINVAAYDASVEVWSRVEKPEVYVPTNQLLLPFAGLENVRRKPKKNLADDMGLPAYVRLLQRGQSVTSLIINKPAWLNLSMHLTDILTDIGPAYIDRPYTACNILILRNHGDRKQVLLARRLSGRYGKGTCALPGGKKKGRETVEQCAIRELGEETGLRLIKAIPISLDEGHVRDMPYVRSVGVLAVETEGEPEQLQPHQMSEWQWFDLETLEADLDELDTTLFEPARWVIEAYRRGDCFAWNDVEQGQDVERNQLELLFPDE